MITAIEFCDQYIEWLEMIDHTISKEYHTAIRKLYCIAPQDLITPVACFASEDHAVGFIYCTLIKTHKRLQKAKATTV